MVELAAIIVVALGLAFGIQAFLIKPYRIPSGSMEPTLAIGQRVLVNRIGNNFGDPAIGDVTVFHPPTGAEDGKECGADANIVVIPTASRMHETGPRYETLFKKLGAAEVTVMDFDTRRDCLEPGRLRRLEVDTPGML